ncbi:aminotransferase class V-fold PLP-dependent enzyme [Porifericola rhodea]|uniref:aminotransferase class V-fold PLP-dependent enzyme n=1 Tax=Porifericola rhodea TaxID=930972 RepID=UPI0026661D92|nr:aminotransferase class V-fold PLP-dependent enzyme [Porifericola rhodea]WKN32665.1 aminotransferase class V-fold PLP-dependent enzyme [Porifericola rhodea]
MLDRRQLLKRLSALPFVGGLLGSSTMAQAATNSLPYRDYFAELGVRTFINAAGTYTSMTGSLLREEVKDAYQYASQNYVMLDELQDKVGERIAELIGCEAATVTSGAFSAMTLGTAGILSGMDAEKAAMIPQLEGSGMKSEVIIQKSHNIGYAHALRNCGVKMVEIETEEELKNAISDKTALMIFINAFEPNGQINAQEWLKIAKKNNLPAMNDCAADVPPVENLWKFTEMGYDLVCFSGGKGIRGPQSAGLLLGKKELIDAARLSAPPRGDTVGRGMKVNKEEVLGMLAALEAYLNGDREGDWKLWEQQVGLIADAANTIKGVSTNIHVPPIANHVPTLGVSWDTKKVRTTGDELKEVLRKGHPSIEVAGGGKDSISITTWMLKPGQERIVARRLQEVLSEASA